MKALNLLKNEKLNINILCIFLIAFPIIDVTNSIITRLFPLEISLGVIVKGTFLLYLFSFCTYNAIVKKDKKTYTSLLILFSIFAVWLTIFFLNRINYLKLGNIINESIYLFKYFYFVFILIFFILFNKYTNIKKEKVKNMLKITFIIYIFLLLIPYITNTGFNSYRIGLNKGTSGWFYAANELGAIMLILLHNSLNIKFDKLINKIIKFIFVPISIILILEIGTKVILTGIIIIMVYNFIKSLLMKNKSEIMYILILLPFTASIMYYSPSYQNFSSLQETIKENIEKPSEDESGEKNENNEENNDNPITTMYPSNIDWLCNQESILSSLTSSRNILLCNIIPIYNESNIVTKISGIGFTNTTLINNSNIEKLIEIDLADIFFRFGIIGFILYTLPLLYILGIITKEMIAKRKFSIEILNYIFIICLSFGISIIAGHILSAPAVSLYLAIQILLLYKETNCNKKHSDI